MKRCVALRHVRFEGLGSLAPPLARRGWSVETADVARPQDIPGGASEADLLVILGGPDAVYDRPPHLDAEIALARARIRAGRPTLGICLGAQVLAAALDAPVGKAPAKEIGWYPVEREFDRESDPVAALLVERSSMAFHWHGDAFPLPAGCEPLARSTRTDCQGFRHRELTYGIQFHPEITARDLPLWLEGYRDELRATPEAQPEAEIRALGDALDPVVRYQTGRFMEAYLARVEARGARR